jgi:outer membrane receptor protein involved in Fe transport
MNIRRALLTAGFVAAAWPATAGAQDRPTNNEDPQGSTGTTTSTEAGAEDRIGEILVTARRFEESLQDTPVSVSVVTSSAINELGLTSIDDFARQSTGISFSQAFGRSTDRPVIRGQSNVLAGVQAGVETGAAYFVDGIYYQGDIQGFDPQSIDRVEIIKGPQSALYGRNTYSGAINYVTRDPTSDFTVSGRLRAAENEEYEAAASLSGPIIPGILGFRAGGRYFQYGGEYTNQLTNRLVGSEETTSAYLTLVLTPNDDIRWRTRLSYQRDDDGPLAIFLQGADRNNCFPGFRSPNFRGPSPVFPSAPVTRTSTNQNQYFCGIIQPQPNNVRLNTDPINLGPPFGVRDGTAFDGVFNEQYFLTNIVEWDIGGSGWILSNLIGYRDNLNRFGTDSDHSDAYIFLAPGVPPAATAALEPAFANTNRDDQTDLSIEVRLATPQDRPLRATIGAYLYAQDFQSTDITFASGINGLPLGTDLSQAATIRNRAVFGMLQWQPYEQLTLSAELRYSEERKTLIDRSTATNIFCAGAQERASQFAFTGTCRPEAVFDGLDPRFTMDFQVNPDVLLYAVVARGRKPGGFNGTAGVTAATQTGQQSFITYIPEVASGGELGVKIDAFDRRLRLAAAVYYNQLTDVQLTSAIPNPTGTGAITSIVTNSGDAETKGFEIEVRAIPLRGMDASLGVSYVDARFTRGCDADEFILRSGGLRPNFDTQRPSAAGLALCDITGRQLPLGSPWTLNGSLSYETAVPFMRDQDLRFFTNVNWSYEDSKYVQVDNRAETGSTYLLNGRLGFRNENFSVALFGRNLTDEDSINLATRWFDLRYGLGTRNLPAGSGNPPTRLFDGRPAQIETGTPRGFFATLRRGRTVGVEATFNF